MWILVAIVVIAGPLFLAGRNKEKTKAVIDVNLFRSLLFIYYFPTVFGVFGTYFANVTYTFGLEKKLDPDVISVVFFQYIITFYVLLGIFYLYRRKFQFFESRMQYIFADKRKEKIFVGSLISVCISIYIFELVRIPSWPLVVLIKDGISAGSIARGEVIGFQIENGLIGVGYIINYFPTLLFIWIIINPHINVMLKISNSMLYLIFYSIFLGKAFFLTPILVIVVCRWILYHKSSIGIIGVAAVMLGIAFLSVAETKEEVISLLLKRLFVVQSEGLFLIRQYFPKQESSALLYGFPFLSMFDNNTFDPSVEIVKILFGTVDGWVNMNSYGLGQGFVMVGNFVVILLPVLIAANIYFCYRIGRYYDKLFKNGFGAIAIVYFTLSLPVNTNFSLLLYFKPMFGVIINLVFIGLIRNITLSKYRRQRSVIPHKKY